MGLFDSIDIAASGMSAERLRMDVISNNIANVNTTRTQQGGPYKRQVVIFEPRYQRNTLSFSENLNREQNLGQGVRVVEIRQDNSPHRLVFNPNHPDANKEGYVYMPNVNIVSEMVDMMTASRAYEANVTAVNAAKSMALKALDIGR